MLREQQIGAYCAGKPCLYLRFFARPFLFELTKTNGRFSEKPNSRLRLCVRFSRSAPSQQFSARCFTFPQKRFRANKNYHISRKNIFEEKIFAKRSRNGALLDFAQAQSPEGKVCGDEKGITSEAFFRVFDSKEHSFSRLLLRGECVRYADSRGAASAHT